jgi:alpha-1,3-rhamnosyl/mannosyltransferase
VLTLGYLCRSLGTFRGGVDVYVAELLRAVQLQAPGRGIRLVTVADDAAVAAKLGFADGVNIVPIRRRGRLLWDHLSAPLACRRAGCDVAVLPRSFRSIWLPCASVTIVYDLMYFDVPARVGFFDQRYFRWLHRLALARSSAVVTFSAFTATRLRQWFPRLPAERIHVLPPGPPSSVFSPGAEATAAPATRTPYVLAVGGGPRKGVERVIAALAATPALADICVVVASVHAGDRARLAAAARTAGIERRVGFESDASEARLAELYRGAVALAYVSEYEGIGIPPLEAMACGCPVVAARSGSIPEVVGDAALLVDPLDVAGIADGILRIRGDAALAADLARRGRDRVRRLDWAITAEALLRVVESVAPGKPG